MTLGELRKALEQIGTGHDGKQVEVWLPGSRIVLSNTFICGDDILIEGNVKAGSALEKLAEQS